LRFDVSKHAWIVVERQKHRKAHAATLTRGAEEPPPPVVSVSRLRLSEAESPILPLSTRSGLLR
jgi:hypothetical protein